MQWPSTKVVRRSLRTGLHPITVLAHELGAASRGTSTPRRLPPSRRPTLDRACRRRCLNSARRGPSRPRRGLSRLHAERRAQRLRRRCGPEHASTLARLRDALPADHDVRSALLCTYGLDPRFFEAEVLPALLPPSSRRRRRRLTGRYLHEERPDAVPPWKCSTTISTGDGPQLLLGYRQVALGGPAFHPKLLVAEYADRLRVVVASANLTRPGWTSLFELFVVDALRARPPTHGPSA